MVESKKYMDFNDLSLYDTLIKQYTKNERQNNVYFGTLTGVPSTLNYDDFDYKVMKVSLSLRTGLGTEVQKYVRDLSDQILVLEVNSKYIENTRVGQIYICDNSSADSYLICLQSPEVVFDIMNMVRGTAYLVFKIGLFETATSSRGEFNRALGETIGGYGLKTGAGLTWYNNNGTYELVPDLKSNTASSLVSNNITSTAGRQYAVNLDSDTKLSVNVPWTDTTYDSETEAVGGTDESLVTTGEKFNWNHQILDCYTDTVAAATGKVLIPYTGEPSLYDFITQGGKLLRVKFTYGNTYEGDLPPMYFKDEQSTIQISANRQILGYVPSSSSLLFFVFQDSNGIKFIKIGAESDVASVKIGNSKYYPSSPTGTVELPAYPTTLPASDTTSTYSSTGTAPVNGTAVATALATLPEPMIFKGSLGTGGTITDLPAAAAANKGYTYKVITTGTYASQSAKVGDTFISDGTSWVLIPSGDEPSGTVTSIGISNGGGLSVSGSPVTSSGTITVSHADTSSQSSIAASTRTYINKVTLDTYGHVTELGTGTETVTNTTYTLGTDGDSVKLTPSSGTAQTITVPYATKAGAVDVDPTSAHTTPGSIWIET